MKNLTRPRSSQSIGEAYSLSGKHGSRVITRMPTGRIFMHKRSKQGMKHRITGLIRSIRCNSVHSIFHKKYFRKNWFNSSTQRLGTDKTEVTNSHGAMAKSGNCWLSCSHVRTAHFSPSAATRLIPRSPPPKPSSGSILVKNYKASMSGVVTCQSSNCINGNPPSKLECPTCNKYAMSKRDILSVHWLVQFFKIGH